MDHDAEQTRCDLRRHGRHLLGRKVSFAMLDAKLGSALSSIVPSDFLRQAQVKKGGALRTGAVVTGRQILRLVDQCSKMTESDRSI